MNSKVLLPETLPELWKAIDNEPDARLFAGGTDLLVQVRSGSMPRCPFIGLERVSGLSGIGEQKDTLIIGACTCLTDILESPLVIRRVPILARSIQTMGSPLVRNAATIAGNICTASPAGDTLPPLYVLHANLELRTSGSIRRMPIHEFIQGPGQTALQSGEILTAIEIPKPFGFNIHHFEKLGQRRAQAISIASIAAQLKVSSSGKIEKARLAWGSVGPTVLTSEEVEESLIGFALDYPCLARAAVLVRNMVSPISDVRASADYRRLVSGNLLLRLLDYRQRLSLPSEQSI